MYILSTVLKYVFHRGEGGMYWVQCPDVGSREFQGW